MSSDTSIGILRTPKNEGFEYRVTILSAIENYGYDDKGNETNDPKIQIKSAREMWSSCDVVVTIDEAYMEAQKLHDEVGWTEYGVRIVEINEEF